MRLPLLLLAVCAVVISGAVHKKVRQAEDVGDDYNDFSSQSVKNAGANHNLKQVTYSTIAPKLEIPTRAPLLNPNPIGQKSPVQTTTKRPVVDYRRGYYFQHYPWDRLPRRYLLRPGMTYVYPPQYHYASYRYPFLPNTYSDPYNIYKSHPGIGYGCGGQSGGCGGGGYPQGYGGYGGYQSSSGCGGGSSGTGCGGYDDDDEDDSYEDSEESGKSGEAKINKKDPLEDLELEDLEKLSKSSDDSTSSSSSKKTSSDDDDVEPTPIRKSGSNDDEDLIDDRKKIKKNFLVKWA